MNIQGIWTVTTLSLPRVVADAHSRTWGYYFTKGNAEWGLQHRCTTEAGYYSYAVIEFFKPGIYVIATKATWFRWDDKTRHWKRCRRPASERLVCNYGMG